LPNQSHALCVLLPDSSPSLLKESMHLVGIMGYLIVGDSKLITGKMVTKKVVANHTLNSVLD